MKKSQEKCRKYIDYISHNWLWLNFELEGAHHVDSCQVRVIFLFENIFHSLGVAYLALFHNSKNVTGCLKLLSYEYFLYLKLSSRTPCALFMWSEFILILWKNLLMGFI